jgi:hypothetical protein
MILVDFLSLFLHKCKNKHPWIVEHPFGTIKRSMNFYYLLLRGFRKVRGEVSIAFFTYNLKRAIKILGVKQFLDIACIYFFIFRKYKLITIAS